MLNEIKATIFKCATYQFCLTLGVDPGVNAHEYLKEDDSEAPNICGKRVVEAVFEYLGGELRRRLFLLVPPGQNTLASHQCDGSQGGPG